MMRFGKTVLIAAPGARARAYIQAMNEFDLLPTQVLTLPGDEPIYDLQQCFELRMRSDGPVMRYRPNVTLAETLKGTDVLMRELPSSDINSNECISMLGGNANADAVFIYAGIGGVLLSKKLLQAVNGRMLHIHGGYVPQYRGSTAFYYSLIAEKMLGASALLLDDGIDTGPILLRKKYKPISGISIDFVIDPMIRADLLIELLQRMKKNGNYQRENVADEVSATYFVIHPVLKHIALSKLDLVR